jgi:hypothetical protein
MRSLTVLVLLATLSARGAGAQMTTTTVVPTTTTTTLPPTPPSTLCTCNASHVCEVKKGTYPVNPGSNLDFGSCALVIDSGTTIQLTTGAGFPVTIKAASLTMNPNAQLLGAPQTLAPDDGGIISITVTGNILLAAGAAIIVDGQDAGGNEIDLTAGGPIMVQGKPGTVALSAHALTANGDGGTIALTASGDVTLNAATSASSGQQGGGGNIWITTTNAKVTVNAPLDASGGEFDGGCIDVESDLDLVTALAAKLNVDGGGLSGSGGLIMLNSNVRGAVMIGGPVSGQAAGSSQTTSEGGGDGGELDSFTTEGSVTVNASVTLPGGTGGGGGGTVDFEPTGDLVVNAPLSLPGSGMGSCGGTATLGGFGTGNVTLSNNKIDVSSDSCGGGTVSLLATAAATVAGEINADSNGTTLGGGFVMLTAGTLGVGGKVHANGGGGEVNLQACSLTLNASGQALATGPNGFNLLQASGPMEVDGTLTATTSNTLDYLDPAHLPVVHSNRISPTAVIVHDNPLVPPLCPGQTTTTSTISTTTTTLGVTTTTLSTTTSTSTTRPTTTTTSSTTTTSPTTTTTTTTTSSTSSSSTTSTTIRSTTTTTTTPPPPKIPLGTIHCDVSLTDVVKPPITNTASTKGLKIKGKGTFSNCDNTGVMGGKYPITEGLLTLSATLPGGASCTNVFDLGWQKIKFGVKWQGVNPKNGKRATVATTKVMDLTQTFSSSPSVGFDFVSAAQPAKKAFEGSTVTLHLVSDQLQVDLQTQCDSPNKKLGTTWNFTGVHGSSTISVP